MHQQSYIAIGDIHGCAATLRALLGKLAPYSEHTYVFMGDYIDRGSHARAVVDQLLAFNERHNCVFLRGNHEQMMLDAMQGIEPNLWLQNGGDTTLASYQTDINNIELPPEHQEFYANTEYFFDTPTYFFVHAGAPPHQPIAASMVDENTHDYFLWGRSHFNANCSAWEKTVVVGHTPHQKVSISDTRICLDTGCVYKRPGMGYLSAVLLPEETVIQQQSLH